MAKVNKIDANVTGLRYSEELSLGVVDPVAKWQTLEVNSYSDFGMQITNVARNPIVDDRQMRKGVATDLDASGGFSTDFTQGVLQDLGQGIFAADTRKKSELLPTATVAATDEYTVPSGGAQYVAGDLLFAQGFINAANNGLKEVASSAAGSVVVQQSLVDETPVTPGTIRRCGFQFAAGDCDMAAAGDFCRITTVTKDLTEIGLIPGEWLWIGGDAALTRFTTAANNGLHRIKSIAANEIVLDKANLPGVTEASAAETVQIFFASQLLKNESDPNLITRHTYQLERTLGAPDDATPTFDHQAEYLVGAVASSLQVNIPTADKMTIDLSFIGTDVEQVAAGVASKKAGTRPTLVATDAFNTSSDIRRTSLSIVSSTEEAPAPLYAYIQELNFTVDNNVAANKAVSVFGAFDLTLGKFGVSGSMTVYFGDIAAMAAVRNNEDITLDAHAFKANQGMSIDMPLLTIGDGRPDVQGDSPITLPISFEAAAGAKVDPNMNHTLMMMFWDYLPDAAM